MSLNYQHHPMREVLFLTSFTDKNFRFGEVNWFAQGQTSGVAGLGQADSKVRILSNPHGLRMSPEATYLLLHPILSPRQNFKPPYNLPLSNLPSGYSRFP